MRRDHLSTALAVAAGLTTGYVAERAALSRRLVVPAPDGPPLGSLVGTPGMLGGPRGVRLHTEVYGPSGAPTAVLAHGYCLTGRVWHEQVAELGDRYRLVTFDQPGHGRSSIPEAFDPDLFGDALAAVMEATTDDPVVLVGHSLGAMAALNLLRRRPDLHQRVRSALLLAPTSSAVAAGAALALGVHALARLERAVPAAAGVRSGVVRGGVRAWRASSDLSLLLLRELGLSRDADLRHVAFIEDLVLGTDPGAISGVLEAILELDEDAALACLPRPTVLVVGKRDRLTPAVLARRMAARCAWAELVELEGVGHALPLEAAADINRLIAELVRPSGARRV